MNFSLDGRSFSSLLPPHPMRMMVKRNLRMKMRKVMVTMELGRMAVFVRKIVI